MEPSVMTHQQHQLWVALPTEAADGTHDWREIHTANKYTNPYTQARAQKPHTYSYKIYRLWLLVTYCEHSLIVLHSE